MPEMIVWPDFFVGVHAERRVFLREAIQRDAHLLLVGLGLGLHRLRDHRLREDHPLEDDRSLSGSQMRVAGRRFAQAHGRGDVAGAHFLDLLALVGVHLQQPPDALLLVLDRVVDRCRPNCTTPEYTRKKMSWPTYGSVMILNARPANGSSSDALRSPSLPFSSSPVTGGMSVGAGM